MAISISQIEKLREKLEVMPKVEDPDRQVSKLEAVRMMVESIRDLQSRGYSIEKISEILSDSGLPIAPTTLKSYLTKVKVTPVKPSKRSLAKKGRDRFSSAQENNEKASKKPGSKSLSNTPVSAGVTPVPKSGFKPKEDSDEI